MIFDYNGFGIYYEEYGSGTPLILLHGNTSSGKMFEPIKPVMGRNRRLIIMDFLGCGRSQRLDKWPEDLWYEWSKQVVSLCGYLDLAKVDLIGTSGGAIAAINVALEKPDLVGALIADSFEGLKADPGLTSQIRDGRSSAKKIDGFRSYLQSIHGDDWESVFDNDTDSVIRHAQNVVDFFHKPVSCLRSRLLLTGSAEDEMFPQNHYCELFSEICRQTPKAKAHIFEHGRHPAMMSNLNEFSALADSFFREQR